MHHAAVLLIFFSLTAALGEECPPARLQDADHWVGKSVDELQRHCGRPDAKRRTDGRDVLVYKLKIYLPDDVGPFFSGETEVWTGGSVLAETGSPTDDQHFYAPSAGKAGNRVAGIQKVEFDVVEDTVRSVDTLPIAWKKRIRRQMKASSD